MLVVGAGASEVVERIVAERGAAAADPLLRGSAIGTETGRESYDVALLCDVLYELSPTAAYDAMRWVRDHLRPGGECVVATRTFLGADGGGLGDRLRTPYAHLAFARDAIEEYCAESGIESPSLPNFMCHATYLVMFVRAGFEIAEVQIDERAPEMFADKLQWYDPDELRVDRFRALLRRPVDDDVSLTELRSVLNTK